MLSDIPGYISMFFGLTVIAAILWFYFASRSRQVLDLLFAWAILQSVLALTGTYIDVQSLPPKLVLFGIAPTIILMLFLFSNITGRAFIDSLNLKTLTYFHTIRIPVEVVLALLFHHGAVSVLMTYEGTNFDLFSGLTAPLVAYLSFRSSSTKTKLLLTWNIICLVLLLNVMITSALAAPSPFQKFSFDQPNIAILYFPFNLLPTVVVPLVLFSHLVAIYKLTRKTN
ncbi:MAG TPA: hypothetical protein VGB63_16950 [Pedobacter sp.]|jgi:hypothetical protein